MEEFETPDPEFVKGFNEGYTLAQHLPEIAGQLDQVKSDSQRSLGFRAGQQEVAQEQKRQRQPDWLRAAFLEKQPDKPDVSKEPNKSRDIEPER